MDKENEKRQRPTRSIIQNRPHTPWTWSSRHLLLIQPRWPHRRPSPHTAVYLTQPRKHYSCDHTASVSIKNPTEWSFSVSILSATQQMSLLANILPLSDETTPPAHTGQLLLPIANSSDGVSIILFFSAAVGILVPCGIIERRHAGDVWTVYSTHVHQLTISRCEEFKAIKVSSSSLSLLY